MWRRRFVWSWPFRGRRTTTCSPVPLRRLPSPSKNAGLSARSEAGHSVRRPRDFLAAIREEAGRDDSCQPGEMLNVLGAGASSAGLRRRQLVVPRRRGTAGNVPCERIGVREQHHRHRNRPDGPGEIAIAEEGIHPDAVAGHRDQLIANRWIALHQGTQRSTRRSARRSEGSAPSGFPARVTDGGSVRPRPLRGCWDGLTGQR